MDTALNFAWTAWHLVDWLWVHCETKAREAFGIERTKNRKADMAAYMGHVRRRYPALAICDVIANAAKHGGVAKGLEDERPEVVTILVAHPQEGGADGSPAEVVLGMLENEPRYSLRIRHDGKSEDASYVFHHAYSQAYELMKRLTHC